MTILLINFIYFVYRIMSTVVLIYVILSWISGMHPTLAKIYYMLQGVLEPLLRPIRKLLWPLTSRIGLDFSPYVLILLLQLIYRIVLSAVFYGNMRI